MSDEIWKEIAFFGSIFGLIFLFWVVTGGPARFSSQAGVFIKPLPPEDTGQIYGGKYQENKPLATTTIKVPNPEINIAFTSTSKPTTTPKSVLHNYIFFEGVAGIRSDDPNDEYVRLAGNDKIDVPLYINNFKLSDGENYFNLPTTTPIYLSKGNRLIITTGKLTQKFLDRFGSRPQNEYWLFLNFNHAVWRNYFGSIYLIDGHGNIIDTLSY